MIEEHKEFKEEIIQQMQAVFEKQIEKLEAATKKESERVYTKFDDVQNGVVAIIGDDCEKLDKNIYNVESIVGNSMSE